MRPNCPLNRPYRPFSGGRPSFKSNEEDPSSRKTSADWAAFLSLLPASLLTGGGQLPTGPHCLRPAAHLPAGAAADPTRQPSSQVYSTQATHPQSRCHKRRSLTALHVTFSPKRELLRSPSCSLRNRAPPHTHTLPLPCEPEAGGRSRCLLQRSPLTPPGRRAAPCSTTGLVLVRTGEGREQRWVPTPEPPAAPACHPPHHSRCHHDQNGDSNGWSPPHSPATWLAVSHLLPAPAPGARHHSHFPAP